MIESGVNPEALAVGLFSDKGTQVLIGRRQAVILELRREHAAQNMNGNGKTR